LAALLVAKREVELIQSHVAPIASARRTWPALERALGAADLESLDPAAAAAHLRRAIDADPLDLNQYAPCAQALLMAGDSAGAARLLDRALELQPSRKDWERLRAIALVRSDSQRGREEIKRLLLDDPDDAELRAYQGDGPWPPYVPAPPPNPEDGGR
jgi:cytochrome c-type biogenesis protein CcmH/NrfG